MRFLKLTSVALGAAILAARGFAQLVTGASDSSELQLGDWAQYQDASYNTGYYSQNNSVGGNGLNSSTSSNLNPWSSVLGNGSASSSTGEQGYSLNSLSNGVSNATFSDTLTSSVQLSASASSTGSNYDVSASSVALIYDDFRFSVSQTADLSISGLAGRSGSAASLAFPLDFAVLELFDTTAHTTQIFFDNGINGAFSGSASLVVGDNYDLESNASSQSYYSLDQYGDVEDLTGADSVSMNYTADFNTPSPTPEPFTIGLGIAGIGLAVRRRMKLKAAVSEGCR